MAYKFQLGSAILSGSTKFEEAVEVAGGLKLSGVDDIALDVSADSFLFRDSDGTMKRDSMADYATAIAGDGLAAASGVLKVDVSDFAGTGLEDDGSENLRIADNGVTLAKMAGITRGSIILGDASGDPSLLAKGTAAQFLQSDGTDPSYVSISGDATVAAGGALTIAAEAVHASMMNDDAISGHSELAHADILDADEMLISDGGVLKRVGVDSLRDHFFGVVSGDATVADGGALTIAANAVEGSMLNTDVISAQTELASDGLAAADELMISDGGTLKKIGVDNLFKDGPGLLGAAAVDVSADHIMFLDGGATGDAKTESLADLATGMAGTALQASSGQLRVKVTGSMARSSGAVGLSGSIAGAALTFEGDANSVTKLDVAVNSTSFAISSDEIQLKSNVAGNGIALGSHVLSVDVATNGGLDANAGASGKLGVDLTDLAAEAVVVADDSIAIISAGNSNVSKKESIADLITAVAGNGLAAASGVLSLDASEVGAAAVASGDQFVFHDATDDSTKKESIDDIATFMAGTGLAAASGVLTLDIDEFGALGGATVAQADSLLISDGGTEKKVTFSNFEDSIFGNVSGDVLVAAGGAATIQANAVEDSMVNDNVATGLAGVGLSAASGVLALDASELSDAAVASGDKFVFQDATDDSTKKESIDDIATFMAGTGLTAASGVLHHRLDVASKADSDTLAAGVNYFADLSSDAAVTLPASPSNGDVVIVKAKGLSSATITINKAGSQTIDGETSVTIESPYGAVTMVYVASNDWRLV